MATFRTARNMATPTSTTAERVAALLPASDRPWHRRASCRALGRARCPRPSAWFWQDAYCVPALLPIADTDRQFDAAMSVILDSSFFFELGLVTSSGRECRRHVHESVLVAEGNVDSEQTARWSGASSTRCSRTGTCRRRTVDGE